MIPTLYGDNQRRNDNEDHRYTLHEQYQRCRDPDIEESENSHECSDDDRVDRPRRMYSQRRESDLRLVRGARVDATGEIDINKDQRPY